MIKDCSINRKNTTYNEIKKTKKNADVFLFDVEASESELEVYQQCLGYVLKNINAERIESEFGAYPDEIEGMIGDIADILKHAGIADKVEDKNSQVF